MKSKKTSPNDKKHKPREQERAPRTRTASLKQALRARTATKGRARKQDSGHGESKKA